MVSILYMTYQLVRQQHPTGITQKRQKGTNNRVYVHIILILFSMLFYMYVFCLYNAIISISIWSCVWSSSLLDSFLMKLYPLPFMPLKMHFADVAENKWDSKILFASTVTQPTSRLVSFVVVIVFCHIFMEDKCDRRTQCMPDLVQLVLCDHSIQMRNLQICSIYCQLGQSEIAKLHVFCRSFFS